MKHSAIPTEWWARHTTSDLVYRLRLRFATPADVSTVWASLREEHTVGDDGALFLGGAAFERASKTEIDLVSGGEDALDSLVFALEDLDEALETTGTPAPNVIDQERRIERG